VVQIGVAEDERNVVDRNHLAAFVKRLPGHVLGTPQGGNVVQQVNDVNAG
jgi:hypothetical protein